MSGKDQKPIAKLCVLNKSKDFQGYGFTLFTDKKKSHCVCKVSPNSPASRAGLKDKDVVVEINDVNVVTLEHSEMIAKARQFADRINLLVLPVESLEQIGQDNLSGITRQALKITSQPAYKSSRDSGVVEFDQLESRELANLFFNSISNDELPVDLILLVARPTSDLINEEPEEHNDPSAGHIDGTETQTTSHDQLDEFVSVHLGAKKGRPVSGDSFANKVEAFNNL